MSRFKRDIFYMKDIQNRADLELLIGSFYQKLLQDDKVNFIFTDIAKINLEHHLPILVDFWEQIVFNTGNYRNNPLQVHFDLNKKFKLTPEHFSIWLQHFMATVDALFAGENAEKTKTRALSIANVMQIKLA